MGFWIISIILTLFIVIEILFIVVLIIAIPLIIIYTIKEAQKSLQEKIYENLDVDEAISKFREKFKQKNRKYKASDFYLWHHILTGSCEQGRTNFCKNNDIDLENGKYTVSEFIQITENSYNGDIIKRLKRYYD